MNLRDWLEAHGITVLRFADMAGTDVGTMRSWISGRAVPSHADRVVIANLTDGDVPIDSWPSRSGIARGARP